MITCAECVLALDASAGTLCVTAVIMFCMFNFIRLIHMQNEHKMPANVVVVTTKIRVISDGSILRTAQRAMYDVHMQHVTRDMI
ncbi:MAG: hypothetical protein EBZ75_14075 [Oxalobacteraceae bacterium]|nr:hypothetical protein [Oxalobacteraceae bacterium]